MQTSIVRSGWVAGAFILLLIFQGYAWAAQQSAASVVAGQLQFIRLKDSPQGQSFKASLTAMGITPRHVSKTKLSRGEISAWSQAGQNRIEATITPVRDNPTGVYDLTIEMTGGAVHRRMPIVLGSVNDRWNQPELFPEPINSAGWEDSPQMLVTRDALDRERLHLAMVYMPIRFDCFHGEGKQSAKNNLCNTAVGPYRAPQRPLMNIERFIKPNRRIDETLPNLIVPGFESPVPKTGATLYVFGFKLDSHHGFPGTPKESPQAIYIENDDGLSNLSSPFIFKQGAGYSLMYNHDRFNDSSPGCHGYEGDVGYDTGIDALILGNYNFDAPFVSLGRYNRVLPGWTFSTGLINKTKATCHEFAKSPLHVPNGLPLEGAQGNPTFYFPKAGQPVAIWDREGSGLGSLQMAVLAPGQPFPGGKWNVVTNNLPILAAPPKQGPYQPEKSQPVLTDREFCARHELLIECATYNGGDPTMPSSFGPMIPQLRGADTNNVGQITAVGEPSLFRFQNQNCMSFVLGEQVSAAARHLNLQIGWVCE